MKCFFVNDFEYINNNLHKISSKNFCVTTSIFIYHFLKQNKFINVHLIGYNLTPEDRYNLLIKYFVESHRIINILDRDKKVLKYIKYKNINIFYNSLRYSFSIDYSSLMFLLDQIKKLIKRKKIEKIVFLGSINLNHFADTFFLDELGRILKIDYEFKHEKKLFPIILNNFNKLKSKLKNVNSITLSQLILYLKQKSTNLYKNKKILVIEPLNDFFYSNYNRKNTTFINYNEIKNKNFEITFEEDLEKYIDILKNKLNCSINIIKHIIRLVYVIDKRLITFLPSIEKKIEKNNIKDIFWCCDPDGFIANVVKHFQKKKINIYGIQHGGSYGLQHYNNLHKHSDYNFCDKFLSYGYSKDLKNKKILELGSFKSNYYSLYSNNIKKKHRNSKITMFIPTPICELYPHKICPLLFFEQQLKICNILNKNKFKKIIKLPQKLENKYPIILEAKNLKNFNLNFQKSYISISKYRPKIIILDFLSTTLYECLLSSSEIILFIDNYNLPPKDVLKLLKKRVHIVKNILEFELIYQEVLENKISKNKDKSFLKYFYLLKKNKSNMKVLKKIQK